MANPRFQIRLIPAALRVVGDLPDGQVTARVNSVIERYGKILGTTLPAVLTRFDENGLRQIKTACWSWSTETEPADVLIGGMAAEVEDAAQPDGDLDGENVSDTLVLLAGLTPVEELALIEWLEQQRAGAA